MEFVQWDAKVKEAMDSFVFDKVEKRPVANNTLDSYGGLLYQVGCDFESVLLDIFSPDTTRKEKNAVNSQHSEDGHLQPRFSNLSAKQHNQYLTYFDQFRNIMGYSVTMSSADQKPPFGGYMNLHRKVFQEQQEYVEYAFQIAVNHMSHYDRVLPEAEKVFKQIISIELTRLQQYVQAYVYHKSFLISVVPYTSDPQPRYQDSCVTLGKPPIIMVPDGDIQVPVYTHIQANVLSLKSISKDENAEKLAKVWNADIVLTISALRTLASNAPPFNNEWEMPMTIKQLEDAKGNKRNVTFIDKALPPKSVNGREKMLRYYKKAVKQFILKNSIPINERDQANTELSQNEELRTSDVEGEPRQMDECVSTNTEEFSNEESIPQLDGADDKVNEKSTPLKKRRVKSVPQSEVRATDVNIWKDSFNKIPKKGTRSTSTSAVGFAKWSSSKRSSAKQNKAAPPSVSLDSEEEALVIDTESEEDHKTGSAHDSSVDEDAITEEPQISFKATEIPSNIIERVLNSERGSPSPVNLSSPEPLLPSDSLVETSLADMPSNETSLVDEPTTLRRSSRKRRKSELTSKEQLPPKPKTRRKSKTVKTEALKDSDDKTDDVPLKSRKTRKRLKKSEDLSAEDSSAGQPKSDTPANPSVNEPEEKSSEDQRRSSTRAKTLSRKSKRLIEQKKTKDTDNSSDETQQKEAEVDSTKATLPKETQMDKKTSLPSTNIIVMSEITVETPQKSKLSSKTKKNELPRRDAPQTAETETTPSEQSDKETGDVLGQILGMQTNRREKAVPEETNDSKKKSNLLQTKTLIPLIPPPVEETNFDSMLQLHSTRLSDPGKGVFYNLWTIGTFRVLIRGCLHGKIQQKGTNNLTLLNTTIRTKLEYQPELGYERLSQSEACAEWLDLQFRPQPSSVLRCRVNPFTRKILRCERVKNEASTYKDFEGAGFNHLKANKLLLSVFQKLSTKHIYEEGSYLICHKHGVNEFAIRKAARSPSNKLVIYDLLREYANPGRTVLCTAQTIPWNSLDPWRQTQWQYNNRRVPMTFDLKPRVAETGKKKKGKKSKQQTEETN